MIQFVLNNKTIETDQPPGMTLLDFIRYDQRLTGTKIGCREGDCGACTTLIGELHDGIMTYRNITSCISPLGNAHGKHVVTVEGLNMSELSPVQDAMVRNSGTQCGFCTPGFVVSLSGYCLSKEQVSCEKATRSIDGNICRCTGYKSIQRATEMVVERMKGKNTDNPVNWAAENGFVPLYFRDIPSRLESITPIPDSGKSIIGGGTDLYVQRHDELHHAGLRLFQEHRELKGIRLTGDQFEIGASCTVSDLLESPELNQSFPKLWKHLKLVSSTPIRNMATLAGNFVNASPIGDMTAIFIALNSTVELTNGKSSRELLLRDLYKGYKILDKTDDEYIATIRFHVPNTHTRFNFEKVSKRTHLDIASVNSAIKVSTEQGVISDIYLSAGGIAPIPTYLAATSATLKGKTINREAIVEAAKVMQGEISPISDVRGSADYKRTLLRQLFFAHFIELFPESINPGDLI